MRFSRALSLAMMASICSAFAPPQSRARSNKIAMIPTPEDISTLAPPMHDFMSHASTWIADAADAAEKEDIGLWESYIQLYKNGLAFVHDNIVDEPLRKMGFTQTWGPSIFLFTAGGFYCINIDCLI